MGQAAGTRSTREDPLDSCTTIETPAGYTSEAAHVQTDRIPGPDDRRLGGAGQHRAAPHLPIRTRPQALEASELGALLLFDFNNIRYVTSDHIGEWARDKMTRFALLTRGGEPHLWDFGSAAKHHRLYARGCLPRTSVAG